MRLLAFSVLACICSLASALKEAGRCRALALGGGGDKCAYQAGVINGLVQLSKPEDVMWDVITGVSAGALNAVTGIKFNVGEEKQMVDLMLSVWKSIKKQEVYKNWRFGPLEGLFFKGALFDNTPLQEYIQKIVANTPRTDRKIMISATDMSYGYFYTWDEYDNTTEIVQAALSSSAIPGVFPPQQLNGEVFNDGGVLMNINIPGAIARCLEKVPSMDHITLDVILCSPIQGDRATLKPENGLDLLLRALIVRDFAGDIQTVRNAMTAFPQVDFRYFVYPKAPLKGSSNIIAFDHDELLSRLDLGFEAAKEAIRNNTQTKDEDKTPHGPRPQFMQAVLQAEAAMAELESGRLRAKKMLDEGRVWHGPRDWEGKVAELYERQRRAKECHMQYNDVCSGGAKLGEQTPAVSESKKETTLRGGVLVQ